MPRGGARANAGRKSDAEIGECRRLLELAVAEEDWLAIFSRLAKDAKSDAAEGNNKAAQILLGYRFGVPVPILFGDSGLPAVLITHIEARTSERPHRARRRKASSEPAPRAKPGVEQPG